jgi:hypothetical protein
VSKDKALKFIKYYDKLKADRHTWDSHWREIAEYILPNKDNINGAKTSGEKKFSDLYDGTAVHSNELLASALHGMLTNPTTPWFGLTTGVPQLDADDDVRKWLQDTVRAILNIMNNSNFQTEIHETYLDIGSLGTGALLIDEDDTDVLRFLSIPIYEVYIDENHKGVVNTVARCFKKPVKDVVDEFGEEVFKSQGCEDLLKKPLLEVEVLHVVGENTTYNPFKLEYGNYRYYSEYILKEKKIILESKGYNTFPMAIPRWTKISGEKYGRSPGMKALPDIKMINQMMKVTIRAAQKIVDPPLQAPDESLTGPVRTSPGAITYYKSGTNDRVEPLITGGRVDLGMDLMDDVRTRIRSAFFIDQLQLREGPQMTATEVMQRTEEQLRLLGPILGRQHNELLKPLIERCFEICFKRGVLPPIPQKLQGKKIDVQYSSMIARAQKTAELESFNRMIGLCAPLFQLDPTVQDNLDADKAFHYISQTLALPYEIIRNKIDVKNLRKDRAEQARVAQQQQQEAHNVEMMNKAAPVIAGANGQGQAAS